MYKVVLIIYVLIVVELFKALISNYLCVDSSRINCVLIVVDLFKALVSNSLSAN